MSNKERFVIFKENIIQENEKNYGQEVRQKYGDASMEEAKQKIKNMTEADYERYQNLGNKILLRLKEAVIGEVSLKVRRVSVLFYYTKNGWV